MPAVSKSQHGIMGMARSYKRGKLKTKGLSASLLKKVKQIAATMTDEQLAEFTSAKKKGLPRHKKSRKAANIRRVRSS